MKVDLEIIRIGDLRDDMKQDPELDFGLCNEVTNCLKYGSFEILIKLNDQEFSMIFCEEHKNKFIKDFGHAKQVKLDVDKWTNANAVER